MKVTIHFASIVAAVGSLLAPFSAEAQSPGSMDMSFRPVLSTNGPTVLIVKELPDGTMLVGGQFNQVNGEPMNALTSLNQDGSRNTNFNIGTGCNNNGVIYGLAVQPDHKILVSGIYNTFNGAPENCLVRLLPDGARDPDFNIGSGPAANEFWGDSWANTVSILTNGQILVSGDFPAWDSHPTELLVRLNTNGSVDTAIQSVVIPIIDEPMGCVLVPTPDGNRTYLGMGNVATFNGNAFSGVLALDGSGSVDTNFSVGAGFNGDIHGWFFQSDGKILLSGTFTEYDGVPCNYIVRLHPNGALDTNFNAPTFFAPASVFADGVSVNAIKQTADGKFVIAGIFSLVNGVPRNSLARLNEDGSLDLSFDPGTGAKTADGQPAYLEGLTPERDGMMLAYGFLDTYNEEPQKGLFRFHVTTPLAAPITINTLTRDLNGLVTLNFTKTMDAIVTLQATQDFLTWTDLGQNALIAGTYNIADPAAANFTHRFYRFKVETSPVLVDSLVRAANGVVSIGFTKTTSATVTLQATQDFVNWVDLGSNTLGAGNYVLEDPAAANFDRRFYRFKIQ